MVRLSDLPDYERKHLLLKNAGPLGPPVWTAPTKPLSEMRFALITTAGIHYRDHQVFDLTDASYRVIDGRESTANLVMSHTSVNFDKSAFMEDINVVFPIDRFEELKSTGAIGDLARTHYSFMGAGLRPDQYELSASQVAGHLKKDNIDAVFLTPV